MRNSHPIVALESNPGQPFSGMLAARRRACGSRRPPAARINRQGTALCRVPDADGRPSCRWCCPPLCGITKAKLPPRGRWQRKRRGAIGAANPSCRRRSTSFTKGSKSIT
ncbi:hypothetical protein CCHR01_13057 [Colletotrichum chrysophilum]|uniref:Uncharacterized protein n=1 Tax=Colletotrichum chrysophilum TaxID=1836956 RepID=A0AAD9AEY8_9PEZI|nr:hypothetical protein CCHR01_13057 [Colletotrichum chrysophilum]